MRFEYADGRMPVAMTRGGARYYLAYDQVGTLRLVTDSTGTVVKRIDYDTFGNVVGDTNPAFSVPFGFAGGLHDRDTGLVRFGHRDYDPETGRWTAKDPILFAGGDTDLYGYCLNDPVNLVDSKGLFWDKIVPFFAKKMPKPISAESIIIEFAEKEKDAIENEWPYVPEMRDRSSQLDDLIEYAGKGGLMIKIDMAKDAYKKLTEPPYNSWPNDIDMMDSWQHFMPETKPCK